MRYAVIYGYLGEFTHTAIFDNSIDAKHWGEYLIQKEPKLIIKYKETGRNE